MSSGWISADFWGDVRGVCAMNCGLFAVRPEWVIFDAADTLLRPEPSVAHVYQQLAAKHGVERQIDVIRERFGPAVREHFSDPVSDEAMDRARWQHLVFDVLETDNVEIFDDLWQHFARPEHWRLFDDVAAVFSWLSERQYRIAIGSNFDARLHGIVAALPPIGDAEHVFISSELGHRKPGLEFFRAIESRIRMPAEKILLVGDSRHADYEGAVAAGWQALHLDRSADEEAKLPIIDSLRRLTVLLS